VVELPLPVIQLGINACNRRDAALALQNLDCTHSAVAPLMVGKEGQDAYNRCFRALSLIVSPSKALSAISGLMKKQPKSREIKSRFKKGPAKTG